MHRDLEEKLSHLLGAERATELLRAAALKCGATWPPHDHHAYMGILDELERSHPGAIAVTARSVRRGKRVSSTQNMRPVERTYERVKRLLAADPRAMAAFDVEIAVRGFDVRTFSLSEGRRALDHLRENATDAALAALFAQAHASLT